MALRCIASALLGLSLACASMAPGRDPIIEDPVDDPTHPARLWEGRFESDGATLSAIAYEAAGAGPHPTAILLHGFPGNERNLDLAQILRRPIVCYGVRTADWMGSTGGQAAYFRGLYLPLLWEPGDCVASPLTIAYTPGHFTALVPELRSLDEGESLLNLQRVDEPTKVLPLQFLLDTEVYDLVLTADASDRSSPST